MRRCSRNRCRSRGARDCAFRDPSGNLAAYRSVAIHPPHLVANRVSCKTPQHGTESDAGLRWREQAGTAEGRSTRGGRGPGGVLAPVQPGSPAGIFTNLATPELFPPLYLKNQGTKIVPIAGFYTGPVG